MEQSPGLVTYRTFVDSFTKVVGYYVPGKPEALFFEAFLPSGFVIEYSTKPLARGGVPRAWLATRARDARGNAMTYGYCFADAGEYTAEYALDEIRYSDSRSVRFVYGTKDPADIRTRYAGGMALQSSLRLEQIQMVGPGASLVRQVRFSYDLGPTTHRTRLTQVEECAGDGVCKPPTRFHYSSSAPGFEKHATNIPTPLSPRASFPRSNESDTRGGPTPGTIYLHVEHLGSVDALTNESGAVMERRSYDPFGQQRNPIWGAPTPMSFSSATTLGYTGHESDDELGLINAKGRIYDPKVGRFLSVDPIVSAPLFGQSCRVQQTARARRSSAGTIEVALKSPTSRRHGAIHAAWKP